jgi:hypothetical protein
MVSKDSPSARARRALLAAFDERGAQAANIWLVYTARYQKQWILKSDAAFQHCLTVEFDREIKAFDLSPKPIEVSVADVVHRVAFDAIVRFCDDRVECRTVVDESPERTPAEQEARTLAARTVNGVAVDWTSEALPATRIRRQNALRMLRCIQSAQWHPLTEIKNAMLARLADTSSLTIEQLVSDATLAEQALRMAAIFLLFQTGAVNLDIDSTFVTPQSVVEVVS